MGEMIVVTGTRKGIGREIALHFLNKGYRVAGCSRGEPSINHDSYMHFMLDIANEREVVNMVRTVGTKFGRIHALVNNAGLASMNHFLTTPAHTVEKLFRTNFLGTFLFTREVAKQMMRYKQGRIVNFSTVAVPLRLSGEAIYASSKSAVEEMTYVSAKELGPYGITVNAIGPSPVKTDLIKAVPQNKLDELLSAQSIRRFGEFRDVINVIDFFLLPNSDFVTGQVIYLGGVG